MKDEGKQSIHATSFPFREFPFLSIEREPLPHPKADFDLKLSSSLLSVFLEEIEQHKDSKTGFGHNFQSSLPSG